MQAVMMEKIFYGVPKKLGYFEVNEILEDAQKVTPRKSMAINETKDDDFEKANDMA